jgi:hypothetical protein
MFVARAKAVRTYNMLAAAHLHIVACMAVETHSVAHTRMCTSGSHAWQLTIVSMLAAELSSCTHECGYDKHIMCIVTNQCQLTT